MNTLRVDGFSAFVLFLTRAQQHKKKCNAMNWQNLFASGCVPPGTLIRIVGRNKILTAVVLQDSRLKCGDLIYKRPSQIWQNFKVSFVKHHIIFLWIQIIYYAHRNTEKFHSGTHVSLIPFLWGKFVFEHMDPEHLHETCQWRSMKQHHYHDVTRLYVRPGKNNESCDQLGSHSAVKLEMIRCNHQNVSCDQLRGHPAVKLQIIRCHHQNVNRTSRARNASQLNLIRSNVWASYVYVHIIQPQVDWLPPCHVHVWTTCNSYDHKPHLENMWSEIRTKFQHVMANHNLPVMLTGKGADGDPKERTMFLQQMYSRWRGRHHPRRSVFSSPLPNTSTWIGLPGLILFKGGFS